MTVDHLIEQELSGFSTYPDRDNQTEEEFTTAVGTSLSEQVTHAEEFNEFKEQGNALAIGVNNDRVAAQAAATQADASRQAAEAAISADEYDVADEPYNFPNTVTGSNGLTFRCIGTNVSGDDPVSSTTGNWIAVTAFAPSIVPHIASYSLTATDLMGNRTLTNKNATGEVIFTWPGLAASQKARFYVATGQNLQIKAPAGYSIRIGDIVTADGGYIRAATVGNWVDLECDGLEIIVFNYRGIWNYDQ